MYDTLISELTNQTGLPAGVVLFRFLGVMFLCGLIGYERERHKAPAGLRTNMLVGLAATAFALTTMEFVGDLGADGRSNEAVRMDPIRLIEAVTSGVAFLAAGMIVYSKGEVTGLTTGASMWLSAAIGASVGLGHWLIALTATICGLVILRLLKPLE